MLDTTEIRRLPADRYGSITPFPVSHADRLRTEFIFKLAHQQVAARLVVVSESHLFQHIPKRLGESCALDDAVRCICSFPPLVDTVETLDLAGVQYVRALRSLQRSLDDNNSSTASETLAAATLLQMHEHFTHQAHVSQRGWIVHANGVIRMLQLRGPSRIRNDLEKSILLAEVGNIFWNAVRDRTACFLAESEWSSILQPSITPGVQENSKSDKELPAMVIIGIGIPGILCRYEQLVEGSGSTPTIDPEEGSLERPTNVCTTKLVADLYEMRRQLNCWWFRYQSNPERTCYNGAEMVKSNARSRSASRLSVVVFTIMANYMLVGMLSSRGVRVVHHEHDHTPDLASMAEECQTLASTVRSELQGLKRADTIAAATTTALLSTMLTRILKNSRGSETTSHCLLPVIDAIFKDFNGGD